MGSKKTTNVTSDQQTTAAPPSWTLPGLESTANLVTQAIPQVAAVPDYMGNFVAQPNAMQLAAPGAYQQAAQVAQQLVNPAMQALQSLPVQSYGSTNPGGIQAAVDAATRPTVQNLMEQVLPGLQSSGIESGAYGGTRSMQVLPQLALRDASSHMQDIAAQMAYQDFVDTRAEQTQRLGLTPEMLDSIMRMSGGSAELLAAGGQLGAANDQMGIDNDLARYQYQIQQPFMGLDTAAELLRTLSGNYGTTTSHGNQTTVEKTGGLGAAVGGALGLASMVGSFAMPGGGSLGGSLVSSLFGKKAA